MKKNGLSGTSLTFQIATEHVFGFLPEHPSRHRTLPVRFLEIGYDYGKGRRRESEETRGLLSKPVPRLMELLMELTIGMLSSGSLDHSNIN